MRLSDKNRIFHESNKLSFLFQGRNFWFCLCSVVLGVICGVILNNEFYLTGGNLIVRRTFIKNQSLVYNRLLLSCFEIQRKNTKKEQNCYIDEINMTIYIKNQTNEGVFLIMQINDHKNDLINKDFNDDLWNFTYFMEEPSLNDSTSNHKSNSLFYIFLDANSNLESYFIPNDINENYENIAKHLISQFTPKLERALFENKSNDSFESHSFGYYIPIRNISFENDTFIALSNYFTEKNFIRPNNILNNKRTNYMHNETFSIDKSKGILINSDIQQRIAYYANGENDLLDLNFSIISTSKLRLINQTIYQKDEFPYFPSKFEIFSNMKKRILYMSSNENVDFELLESITNTMQKLKNKYGSHKRMLRKETNNFFSAKIPLFPNPKSLFSYKIDLYLEISAAHIFYETLENAFSLSTNKSYISVEYSLIFDIFNDDDKLLAKLIPFAENCKINNTLLEIIPYYESFQKYFMETLTNLSENTQNIMKKANDFFLDLKMQKIPLFKNCYQIDFLTKIFLDTKINFDIEITSDFNIKQIFFENEKALLNFYKNLSQFTHEIQAWIPTADSILNLPWSNLPNSPFVKEVEKFKFNFFQYDNKVKNIREFFIKSLFLNLTQNFFGYGRINLEVNIACDFSSARFRNKINGTLIGFMSNSSFTLNLFNLSQNISNFHKCIEIASNFTCYLFLLKFWRVYEVKQCKIFEQEISHITRNLNENSQNSSQISKNFEFVEKNGFSIFFQSFFSIICGETANFIQNQSFDIKYIAQAVIKGNKVEMISLKESLGNDLIQIKNLTMNSLNSTVNICIGNYSVNDDIRNILNINENCDNLFDFNSEIIFPIGTIDHFYYHEHQILFGDFESISGKKFNIFNDNNTN